MFLLMHVHGYTAAVILNGDTVVFVDAYVYFGAVAGQGFVNGVVHHFVNQVVEPTEVNISDIHGGTYPYCFKAF
jgi:hypothetical protein